MLLAGVLLILALLFQPTLGITLMWNILIPLAPLLIVVAPGLWRNICPMATFSLLPRHFGLSRKKLPSRRWIDALGLGSLIALALIVPLRHLYLDTNGPLTALMLLLAAAFAWAMGMAYEWRSGWCTSLCPIHPVEKLYGFSPALCVDNARCDSCRKCTRPCPDWTRSLTPLSAPRSPLDGVIGHLLTGGFVGFIWGWNQLPDYQGVVGWRELASSYLCPFASAGVSLLIYSLAQRALHRVKAAHDQVVRIFATAAVITYYWYRLPALGGFGPFPGTGMLYDLRGVLPASAEAISHLLSTAFFIYFLILRKAPSSGWMKPARRSDGRLAAAR